MKRLSSSSLISICPSSDEQNPGSSHVCSREFQSLLDGIDEEGCLEESGHISEKKRRLSVDQVKALEKNFETENKLEPERKVKLAQELGLQPRQVAVWFQNRRARWKTKQLERDYGVLKANYDSLKQDLESIQNDNEALIKEIRKLKARLKEENTESNLSVAEKEALASESDNPAPEPAAAATPAASLVGSDPFNGQPIDFKDGPSDSDSSAILNEGNSPTAALAATASDSSPPGEDAAFLSQNRHLLISSSSSSPPSSITYFSLLPDPAAGDVLGGGGAHQAQFVKMEEHNFFSEEGCNFFSEDQAPTLHWYTPESWT